MHYIICSCPLKEVLKYKMPVKDKHGNLDYDAFYESAEGKEFVDKIEPLVLASDVLRYHKSDRLEFLDSVANDLMSVVLFYEPPVYAYIVSDRWYYRNVKISGQRTVHAKKWKEGLMYNPLYEDNPKPRKGTPYVGDIHTAAYKAFQQVNLKSNPVWCFRYFENSEEDFGVELVDYSLLD